MTPGPTSAGLTYARQVLAADPKTTNADLDTLTVAIYDLKRGQDLRPDLESRANRLFARALLVALKSLPRRLYSTPRLYARK